MLQTIFHGSSAVSIVLVVYVLMSGSSCARGDYFLNNSGSQPAGKSILAASLAASHVCNSDFMMRQLFIMDGKFGPKQPSVGDYSSSSPSSLCLVSHSSLDLFRPSSAPILNGPTVGYLLGESTDNFVLRPDGALVGGCPFSAGGLKFPSLTVHPSLFIFSHSFFSADLTRAPAAFASSLLSCPSILPSFTT